MKWIILYIGILWCLWDIENTDASTDLETQGNVYPQNYRNLVWNCVTNEDCTTPKSSCVEKTCQCQVNFIFNAGMTECIKVAEKYGDTCEETLQCTAYLQSGGDCNNGICSCAPGYHYLHGRCNKSSGLKEKCRSNDDCFANSDFESLSCTNNTCGCTNGFYQREYRACRREAKEPGADCMIDLDCTYSKNATCDKTKGCIGVPPSSEKNAFRMPENETPRTREPRAVDAVAETACINDKDCATFGAAGTCGAMGTCICKPGYFLDGKPALCYPELGENCVQTDKSSIKNAECRNGQWNCKGANIPSVNNRKCLKVTRAYNNSCTQDEQCYIFGPDASCVKKKCVCNENSHYSEEKMFCWRNKGVGERCESEFDCYVPEFDVVLNCNSNFICECPSGTHVNAAGTACIQDEASVGDLCTADEDCMSLANSVCENGKCTCAKNYFDEFGQCVAGIGAFCRNDAECKTNNSTCRLGECECIEHFVSPFTDVCVEVSSFGEGCQYDLQCSANAKDTFCAPVESAENSRFGDSETVKNGTCLCKLGYHWNYAKCYRMRVLHEPCESKGECYVESGQDSVVCRKGVCTCEYDRTEMRSTVCASEASPKMELSIAISFTILITRFIGIL